MEHHITDSFLFAKLRREIAFVYDVYVDYVGKSGGRVEIPNTFRLVSAFACFFYLDVKLVSGTTLFFTEKTRYEKDLRISTRVPHHWLTWKDEDHIIDVLPADGRFGVSVPQAIIQTNNRQRFFPKKEIFHPSWSELNKYRFSKDVDDIATMLDDLMEKIPY